MPAPYYRTPVRDADGYFLVVLADPLLGVFAPGAWPLGGGFSCDTGFDDDP
jgi:hypothetical protein